MTYHTPLSEGTFPDARGRGQVIQASLDRLGQTILDAIGDLGQGKALGDLLRERTERWIKRRVRAVYRPMTVDWGTRGCTGAASLPGPIERRQGGF